MYILEQNILQDTKNYADVLKNLRVYKNLWL